MSQHPRSQIAAAKRARHRAKFDGPKKPLGTVDPFETRAYRPTNGPEVVLAVPITCADEVYKIVKPIIGSAPVEVVVLLCLDARGRLIGSPFEVTRGTLTVSVVHPREVFHEAIARRAAQIVLVHNHPSGDVAPSDADMELTQRLREGGEMLGIPLVDHLVVTDQTWRSLV